MADKHESCLNEVDKQVEEKRKIVLEEQRHVSEKVSDLCRYIGFGMAAANYAVFTSSSAFSLELLVEYKTYLLISASLAILTIFFDYLQFLFGYVAVRDALSNQEDDYKYKLESCFYKGRFWFFYAKQVAVISSVLVLLYTLFSKLIA